ncbi:hypothetical protein SUGI_0858630 [Cryptomeria japonica]|uniref:protein PLASTID TRANSCRIPTIONALLY ACTIVE 16, chloroplastic n=1 Tax=Cryptomeria japonica TaxID=3369 RepID=UPI0024149C4B|nr:protein PLASTID TRANSCRIPTIONALLY ACTIVE 16, chloroplastic [Cryptomeria japonica]GLJ41489.1 hypothetical protein SUGI_0858630 [Cryptomeria japonica]
MATLSSAFSCRLGNSHKNVLNKNVFVPPNHKPYRRHKSKRLLLVTAEQSSFLKNLSWGFGKKSEDEDAKPVVKESSSIVLSNKTNPFGLGKLRQQEPKTVFVAGATGQFGARISQMLLRQGFTVRAGVTDLSFAQDLAQFAIQYKIIGAGDAKRLNAVEFDIKDAESTAKAIGNASKAVVSIGPTENGPSSQVTTSDAFYIIEAAKIANVKHVVVVYESQGVSPNVLDGISSFFTNIFGKSEISLPELIDKIVEMNMSYTILKASSVDEFASNNDNNLVLKTEGKEDIKDKVSRTQVACVVSEVLSNTSVSENKTFEVAASPSAPLKPIGELLSAIPTDGRKEAYVEAQARAKAEEDARIAAENERQAKELVSQLEAEAKRLAGQEAKATQLADQVKTVAGTASIDYFVGKAKEFGIDLFGNKTGTQVIKSSDSQPQKNFGTLLSTVKGKVKSAKSESFDVQAVTVEGEEKSAALKQDGVVAVSQPQVNKFLGGLFKQETIYVDDD